MEEVKFSPHSICNRIFPLFLLFSLLLMCLALRSALSLLCHLPLGITLKWSVYYDYSQGTDKENNAQRGEAICPKSHSWVGGETGSVGLIPGSLV